MLINAVVVRSVSYKLKVTSTGGETLLFWQLFLSWLHTTVVVSQHKTSQIECKSFHTTLKDLLAYPRYWNPLLKEELCRFATSEEVSWKFIVGQTTGNLSPVTCWSENFQKQSFLDCFVEDELGSSCAETLVTYLAVSRQVLWRRSRYWKVQKRDTARLLWNFSFPDGCGTCIHGKENFRRSTTLC